MQSDEPAQIAVAGWRESFASCRGLVLAVVLLTLVISTLFALRAEKRGLVGDEGWYSGLADNILQGHGFATGRIPHAEKPPGEPYFLALVYELTGRSTLAARLVQGVASSLISGLTVLIAFRFTGRKRVALISGLASALNVYILYLNVRLLTECLFGLWALLFMLALDRAHRTRRIAWFALAAVLLGLATYFRPALLLYPLPLFVVMYGLGFPTGRLLKGVLVFAVVIAAVLMPWAVRNYRVFGVFTPLPAEGGYVLYWNWDFEHKPNTDLPWMARNLPGLAGKVGYERDSAIKRITVERIKANPVQYAKSAVLKALGVWTSVEWLTPGKRLSKILGVFRLVFLILAVSALLKRELDPFFRLCVITGMVYLTIIVAFLSSAEYRFTFWIMPFLYVLVGYTIDRYLRTRASLRKKHPL